VTTGVAALRGLSPPVKVFAAATGAGAGVQAALWSVPGSSAFVAGAAFPYAPHEIERFLGFTPARFCDTDAALELAVAAYVRARETCLAEEAAGTGAGALGLGLTASVASLVAHRGDHRVFAATLSARGAVVWSARLPKGTGEAQRSFDGGFADRLGVHALLAAAGIAGDAEAAPGVEVTRRDAGEAELRALLFRRPAFGPGDARAAVTAAAMRDCVLMPGSFDPCHDGHAMLADAVERQVGRRVVYALTADPVHKPRLRVVDVLDRVASVRRHRDAARAILLTERDPLFIDKARQFPGAGIAIGADALVRMLDPAWGPRISEMLAEFRALGTRFYVAGRMLGGRWTTTDDVAIPGAFKDLFTAIDGSHDASSSALRRQRDTAGSER